jgi:hypothetical protein
MTPEVTVNDNVPNHNPPADRQVWYCISISWGGSPQDELIVTRDARLTMRRTVDYLARTADFTDEWVRQHRPPDAATAPIADVTEWLEEFRENTDRPALEWHRTPARIPTRARTSRASSSCRTPAPTTTGTDRDRVVPHHRDGRRAPPTPRSASVGTPS